MAAADVLSPPTIHVASLLMKNFAITSHQQQHEQHDMCVECDGRVYAMEKLVAGASTYHKWCFRCAHCNSVLSDNNYAMTSSCIPYCKAHYAAIFKRKGTYDEFAVKRIELNSADLPRDEGRVKPTSSSSSGGGGGGQRVYINDSSWVTKRLIQSTSLQPLKPVNRSDDDVTVTSSPPAANVRQTREIFEPSELLSTRL